MILSVNVLTRTVKKVCEKAISESWVTCVRVSIALHPNMKSGSAACARVIITNVTNITHIHDDHVHPWRFMSVSLKNRFYKPTCRIMTFTSFMLLLNQRHSAALGHSRHISCAHLCSIREVISASGQTFPVSDSGGNLKYISGSSLQVASCHISKRETTVTERYRGSIRVCKWVCSRASGWVTGNLGGERMPGFGTPFPGNMPSLGSLLTVATSWQSVAAAEKLYS